MKLNIRTEQGLTLGETIAYERHFRHGLTLAEAADRAGISRAAWRAIERDSGDIKIATIAAAAEVLGYSVVIRLAPKEVKS